MLRECRFRAHGRRLDKRGARPRELKRFVKVPFALHRDSQQWVAPLIFERMEFLDRKKNPYFEHAEVEYFLAEREGKAVGRISAQIDQRWDEFQGGSDAIFGFFETARTPRSLAALLGAASEWARKRAARACSARWTSPPTTRSAS